MLTKRLIVICHFLHLKEVNYYQRALVFGEGACQFLTANIVALSVIAVFFIGKNPRSKVNFFWKTIKLALLSHNLAEQLLNAFVHFDLPMIGFNV